MKKLLVLLTLLSINYFSYSQEFEKSNSVPVKYDDSFIDKTNNVLRVKFEENFVSKQEDIKDIAIDYLKKHQSQYGIRDVLDEMVITNTFESPMGYYVYFRQMFNKIPIFATNFTVFLDKDKTVRYVLNEFRYFEKHKEIPGKPTIDAKEALQIVRNHLKIEGDIIIGEPISELVYFESADKGLELAWKIEIMALRPLGDWQFFINASDKHIIQAKDITENYDHILGAYVYDPNPLVTARKNYDYGGGYYAHNNGTTNQYLDDELQMVILHDMQTASPLYNFAFLSGTYAWVIDKEPPNTTIPVVLFNSVPYWTRNQEEFLALMCYYHVTKSGRRVAELGYMTSGLNELQIDPYSSSPLSSSALAYYRPSQNYISMGEGYYGPKSAEDADIIWHEYAHALQTHLGQSGYMTYTGETKAIKEGSSDYWAASHRKAISDYQWKIGMLWVNSRDIYDSSYTYPASYNTLGEDWGGKIWTTALLDIWNLLGKDITDKLFLETHLRWGLSPTMRQAARYFLDASQYLDGGKYYCTIKSVFEKRGLFVPLTFMTSSNLTYNTDRTIAADDFEIKHTIKVTNGATLTIITCGNFTLNDKIQLEPGANLITRASNVLMEHGWVVPSGAYFSIHNN